MFNFELPDYINNPKPMFQIHYPPIDLRDWFAGLAMQSAIAKCESTRIDEHKLSAMAYHIADAMMEHRKSEDE